MKPKALPLVAFVFFAASVASALVETPAPPAPPAVAAPALVSAPPHPVVAPVAMAAAAPRAPVVPEAPPAPRALMPAEAPAQPVPPQEPAQAPAPPPAVATTLFVAGNFLGVRTEEITRENMQRYGLSGEPRGVGVRTVLKDSPAEKAGLRADDVIVRFDGEPVTSVRKLTRLVEESKPNHTARIAVLRGGSEQELSASLVRRETFASVAGEELFDLPSDIFDDAPLLSGNSEQWKGAQEKMQRQWEELAQQQPHLFGATRRIGVATNALGKQLAEYFGVTHGVLINSVEDGSPAEKAGLKAGDIVTEADGRKVTDVDDLTRALSAKAEGEVTLTVVRERNRRTVRVTPERRPTPRRIFTPGMFQILDSPVAAAIALPHIQMRPDDLTMPRAVSTPRLLTAPRISPRPLGGGVFSLRDRVL